MDTLESLKRRIESAEDLHSIVRTMKALAAVSIRQYEQAVESLAEYNRAIELGLYAVLRAQPSGPAIRRSAAEAHVGAVVFGSDQGMCGQFNDQIAQYAVGRLERLRVPRAHQIILAVGARVTPRLEEAGETVVDTFAVPGSIAGITPSVQDVLLEIESWRSQRAVDQIYLFYNRRLSAASYRPHSMRLLPVDLARFQQQDGQGWAGSSLPFFTMERPDLLSALVRQYLFVSLYRAFAESLASENASRLASMQAAERNIQERLDEFLALYHNLRQTTITAELLDIVSGFEVLTGQDTV